MNDHQPSPLGYIDADDLTYASLREMFRGISPQVRRVFERRPVLVRAGCSCCFPSCGCRLLRWHP